MKDKKTILILILVLTIGIIGLTVAYFSNSTTLNNIFETKQYGDVFTEEFVAPTNWLPGETTNKSVVATNTGEVDQAVRVKLTESWKTANNGTLNGWIHTDGTKSTHETENDIANDERVAIINFDNDSDWTKVGDYYYYNYKLAPNESTSSLIKSVTFNSKTKLDDTCESSTNGNTKTVTCNSSGSDYDNATYKLKIDIETVQYNKYKSAWGTSIAIAEEKSSSGVDYLLSNNINADGAVYNTQTKSKMFKMTHPATEQTPAQTEYRYIGDNPNNYVYFNCDDLSNQSASTCEVWRIIGVFDVDDGTGNYEQRIKLVRGSALPDTKQWDTRNSELDSNNNWGKNEWVGSLMQTYLNDNGDYYMRSGSAANYGLKTTAKNLISDAKYYLGGTQGESGNADAMYIWERGNETFSYDTYCLYSSLNPKCSINYCENNPTDELCNATRNKSWIGKVALLYPSDYALVYAYGVDAGCYGHPLYCQVSGDTMYNSSASMGWIYNSNNLEGQNQIYDNWFVSPLSTVSNFVFGVRLNGSTQGYEGASSLKGIRPVLYLSSNVKITSGTGEQNNPFKLGL